MRFHYVASQPNGEIIEGNIDAQGTADVLTFLATKGLKPVSIQQVKGLEQRMPRRFWGQAISVVDKVFPLEKAAEAHQYLEDRKQFGKVILSLRGVEDDAAIS